MCAMVESTISGYIGGLQRSKTTTFYCNRKISEDDAKRIGTPITCDTYEFIRNLYNMKDEEATVTISKNMDIYAIQCNRFILRNF